MVSLQKAIIITFPVSKPKALCIKNQPWHNADGAAWKKSHLSRPFRVWLQHTIGAGNKLFQRTDFIKIHGIGFRKRNGHTDPLSRSQSVLDQAFGIHLVSKRYITQQPRRLLVYRHCLQRQPNGLIPLFLHIRRDRAPFLFVFRAYLLFKGFHCRSHSIQSFPPAPYWSTTDAFNRSIRAAPSRASPSL